MMSRRCAYGIQSLVYLSQEGHAGYVPVHEISDALSIPGSFLSKILADLATAKILASRKGPHGGVMLRRDPDRLSVHEVVVVLDGPALFESCILGLPGCGSQTPCPMHSHWSETRRCIQHGFEALSIAQLASDEDATASFLLQNQTE